MAAIGRLVCFGVGFFGAILLIVGTIFVVREHANAFVKIKANISAVSECVSVENPYRQDCKCKLAHALCPHQLVQTRLELWKPIPETQLFVWVVKAEPCTGESVSQARPVYMGIWIMPTMVGVAFFVTSVFFFTTTYGFCCSEEYTCTSCCCCCRPSPQSATVSPARQQQQTMFRGAIDNTSNGVGIVFGQFKLPPPRIAV